MATRIPAFEALRIAQEDGIVIYEDLSDYRVEVTLEDDGWHVKHLIRQRNGSRFLTGGGPHYVIDATTGAILNKKYYQ